MHEYRLWPKLRSRTDKIGSGVTPKGGEDAYTATGIPLVRSQNVKSGRLDLTDVAHISAKQHDIMQSSALRPNDVLLNITGASIGRSCVVPPHLVAGNVNQHVCIIRLSRGDDPHFVSQFLNSHHGQKQIWMCQGGGSREGLNYEQIGDLHFPPIEAPEQQRIAEILRTWDKAIEKTERLIEAKEKTFEYLALSLLTGHRRLGNNRSKWRGVSLTDVTMELSARNGGRLGNDSVMGVSKFEGMIPMKDHVRAADISRYKIVTPSAFAYNPMRLNIGSIAKNEHGRDVLVSPDYVAFSANDGALDTGFFDHMRRTRLWSRFVESAGSGGVRVRIYYDDLADFGFDLPPIDEQRQIAGVLDTARREITLLKSQRDARDKQKRGLMQKLLTGEWRVNVSPPSAKPAKSRAPA